MLKRGLRFFSGPGFHAITPSRTAKISAVASHARSEFIAIALFLPLTFRCFDANLFVILLESCKIFGASENSPSSMPSPTYQCTNARFEYMRSNLWSMREKTSAMAVELLIMQQARITLARSPPGTTVGG